MVLKSCVLAVVLATTYPLVFITPVAAILAVVMTYKFVRCAQHALLELTQAHPAVVQRTLSVPTVPRVNIKDLVVKAVATLVPRVNTKATQAKAVATRVQADNTQESDGEVATAAPRVPPAPIKPLAARQVLTQYAPAVPLATTAQETAESANVPRVSIRTQDGETATHVPPASTKAAQVKVAVAHARQVNTRDPDPAVAPRVTRVSTQAPDLEAVALVPLERTREQAQAAAQAVPQEATQALEPEDAQHAQQERTRPLEA